jgi:hypothetical protein
MRQSLVVALASATLIGTWAAIAAQPGSQPAARAYLSYGFGAPKAVKDAPLHFGLRMDYDQGPQAVGAAARPPLLQFDLDSRGNRIASAGGLPFAGRLVGPLRQNEDGAPAAEGAGSSFSFFDWSVLAIGLGGVGFLIYEVTKGKDDPNPPPSTTGGTTGGLLGGLLGGVLGGTAGLAGASSELQIDSRDLGGGNGSMGDLMPQR